MTLEQLSRRGPREGIVEPGESLGRVAVEHRDGLVLYTEAGGAPARLAGRLRHDAEAVWPAVGDRVAFRAAPDRGTAPRVVRLEELRPAVQPPRRVARLASWRRFCSCCHEVRFKSGEGRLEWEEG